MVGLHNARPPAPVRGAAGVNRFIQFGRPDASEAISLSSPYQELAKSLCRAGPFAVFEVLCIAGQHMGAPFERELTGIIRQYQKPRDL